MKESHVVLLPYIEASQSGVVPVAYYNCCPVIVTNVGGLPESVVNNETGFIIEPSDVEKISEIISEIVDNRALRERIGRFCHDYYRKNLRWEVILKKVADFLDFH